MKTTRNSRKIIASICLSLMALSSPISAYASLTEPQISAILGLLRSFGVDSQVLEDVNNSLRGTIQSAQSIPIPEPVLKGECSMSYETTKWVNGNRISGILSWSYENTSGLATIERAKIYGGSKGTFVPEWNGYITFLTDPILTSKIRTSPSIFTVSATEGDYRLIFEDGTECFAISK